MRKVMKQVTAGVAGLLLLGAVSTGFAQQTPAVEDQLRQIQEQLAALRKEVAEVKGARPGQMPMPMSPGTTGGQTGQQMGQMMPMCPMMGMMAMGQTGQMGGMGAPAPQPKMQ